MQNVGWTDSSLPHIAAYVGMVGCRKSTLSASAFCRELETWDPLAKK